MFRLKEINEISEMHAGEIQEATSRFKHHEEAKLFQVCRL